MIKLLQSHQEVQQTRKDDIQELLVAAIAARVRSQQEGGHQAGARADWGAIQVQKKCQV